MTVQHVKSAIRRKCHMKIVQHRKRATWKECNMKQVEYEKSPTWKECNIEKAKYDKNATWRKFTRKNLNIIVTRKEWKKWTRINYVEWKK